MSVKIILKGKIVEVCEVVEVGENKLKKQVIRVLQPAYRDDFGDVKGSDEVWQFSALGDRIAHLKLTAANEGDNGTFTAFLRSNTVKPKSGGETIYPIEGTLFEWEKYEKGGPK